jgi:RNA polymerase sigma-70 factor, ECF subfamily
VTAAVAALERAYRDERAAVLATLTRRLDGNLALAEDAVHDAVLAAAVEWDRRGVPDRPGAWLTTTAWRKALDRIRRDRALAARLPFLLEPTASDDPLPDFERSSLEDDRLRMLFACCHPALAVEARMALTLRSVTGLTVPEIARGFVTSEGAMERRLVRARRKVADARIPFRVPPDDLLPERLAGVLRVVYLLFNEGHTPTAGDEPLRGELCEEAIRLGRLLARLMPDDAETLGLLALMLLVDARRPARLDETGAYVSLENQDRTRWDDARVEDGQSVLARALRLPLPGPYAIQAAIAAVHSEAASFEATDWEQIAALYGELARRDPTPIVAINRAVAVAFVEGWEAGLTLLDGLDRDSRLARYQPLHAARAELLRRAGDAAGADAAYARAISLTDNTQERAALERRRLDQSRRSGRPKRSNAASIFDGSSSGCSG